MDAKLLTEVLQKATGEEWHTSKTAVGFYKFSFGWYVVTVEARNPKEDETWRITVENKEENTSSAIGPVQTSSVDLELQSLVEDFFDEEN